jgi:hypothetical protein
LGADNAGDWEVTQRALRRFANGRQWRTVWLQAFSGAVVLLMLLGFWALLLETGPEWLTPRLMALFLMVGLPLNELRQLKKRGRPLLLKPLAPEGLPASAWAFVKPLREGRHAAWWHDKACDERRIPVGLMEPIEIVLLLSDNPDLRAIGLPWPRDMDEPDVVVAVLAGVPAAPPVQLATADEPLELAGADADSSAEAAVPAKTQEEDTEENMGRRGFIDRASSVYARPFEAFRQAVAEQFDPDVAGDNQADFHAVLSIHAAWEESPGTNSATRLIQKARRRFENRKRTDRAIQHIILPDDRSLRRLIREERREFLAIRKALGMRPKLEPMRRPSSKRRKGGAGLQDEPRGSI